MTAELILLRVAQTAWSLSFSFFFSCCVFFAAVELIISRWQTSREKKKEENMEGGFPRRHYQQMPHAALFDKRGHPTPLLIPVFPVYGPY